MKKIQKIQVGDVELNWLKAEWYNPRFKYINAYLKNFYRVSGSTNVVEKSFTYLLHGSIILRMERGKLLSKLPNDTKWFEATLTLGEFGNLQVICESSWYDEFVKQHKCITVEQIAARVLFLMNEKEMHGACMRKKTISHFLRDSPHAAKIAGIYMHGEKHEFKEKLILLKSSRSAEISILEGNHRAVAFYMWHLTRKRKLPTNFMIGISPQMQKNPFYNYKKRKKN